MNGIILFKPTEAGAVRVLQQIVQHVHTRDPRPLTDETFTVEKHTSANKHWLIERVHYVTHMNRCSGQAALIRGGVTCDWPARSGDQIASREEKFRFVSQVSCAACFSLVNY